MSSPTEFEMRRRERRRRERLRKKRIRAAILLIALIGMIVIICVAVSTFAKRGEADAQNGGAASETTKVSHGSSRKHIGAASRVREK